MVAGLLLAVGLIDLGWTTGVLLAFLVACRAVPATYGAVVGFAPTNTHRRYQEPPP